MTKTMMTTKLKKAGFGTYTEKASNGYKQCVNVFCDKEEAEEGGEPAFVLNYLGKDSWCLMNCYGTSEISGVMSNTEEILENLNNWIKKESNRI